MPRWCSRSGGRRHGRWASRRRAVWDSSTWRSTERTISGAGMGFAVVPCANSPVVVGWIAAPIVLRREGSCPRAVVTPTAGHPQTTRCRPPPAPITCAHFQRPSRRPTAIPPCELSASEGSRHETGDAPPPAETRKPHYSSVAPRFRAKTQPMAAAVNPRATASSRHAKASSSGGRGHCLHFHMGVRIPSETAGTAILPKNTVRAVPTRSLRLDSAILACSSRTARASDTRLRSRSMPISCQPCSSSVRTSPCRLDSCICSGRSAT